jgi:hypothetical protein
LAAGTRARLVCESLPNGDRLGTLFGADGGFGTVIHGERLPCPFVEPVEINAGGYYLRMLRADDRPAVHATRDLLAQGYIKIAVCTEISRKVPSSTTAARSTIGDRWRPAVLSGSGGHH